MRRRRFLEIGVGSILVLPAGTFLVQACGGSSSSAGGDPAAPPQKVGTQIVYTSSLEVGHSHTFAIDQSAFTSPPPAGVSGSTSSNLAHTHSVAVAQADLQHVEAGQTVKITTGPAGSGGHSHTLTLVKVA